MRRHVRTPGICPYGRCRTALRQSGAKADAGRTRHAGRAEIRGRNMDVPPSPGYFDKMAAVWWSMSAAKLARLFNLPAKLSSRKKAVLNFILRRGDHKPESTAMKSIFCANYFITFALDTVFERTAVQSSEFEQRRLFPCRNYRKYPSRTNAFDKFWPTFLAVDSGSNCCNVTVWRFAPARA